MPVLIRSTAKAIILHEGRILLNRCADSRNGTYYALPGGGRISLNRSRTPSSASASRRPATACTLCG